MKTKPKLNQVLYRLNVGYAARHQKQFLTPVTVTKVGRKYFTTEKLDSDYSNPTQYCLESWRQKSDYSATTKLYESEQAWEDEKEARVICRQLSDAFSYGNNRDGLALSKLREIKKILDSNL